MSVGIILPYPGEMYQYFIWLPVWLKPFFIFSRGLKAYLSSETAGGFSWRFSKWHNGHNITHAFFLKIVLGHIWLQVGNEYLVEVHLESYLMAFSMSLYNLSGLELLWNWQSTVTSIGAFFSALVTRVFLWFACPFILS